MFALILLSKMQAFCMLYSSHCLYACCMIYRFHVAIKTFKHFEMLSAIWQLFVLDFSMLSLYGNVTGMWGIRIIISPIQLFLHSDIEEAKKFLDMISSTYIYFQHSVCTMYHVRKVTNIYGSSEEWLWETSLGNIDHGWAGIYNCKLFCCIFDNTWV